MPTETGSLRTSSGHSSSAGTNFRSTRTLTGVDHRNASGTGFASRDHVVFWVKWLSVNGGLSFTTIKSHLASHAAGFP
jgi:hypothetical protein